MLSVIPLRDPKGNGRSSQCSKRRALIHHLGWEFPSYLREMEREGCCLVVLRNLSMCRMVKGLGMIFTARSGLWDCRLVILLRDP